jgi:hypothetical protein
MKELKLNNLLFIVMLFVLMFGTTSCYLWEDDKLEDKCKNTTVDTKVLDVSVKVRVRYLDNTPFEGPVRLRVYKTYCNEDVKGDFTLSGTTNEEGYFDPHYRYQYNYENLQDRVTLQWYAKKPSGEEVQLFSETYYYDDAEEESWILLDVYDLRVHWEAPE